MLDVYQKSSSNRILIAPPPLHLQHTRGLLTKNTAALDSTKTTSINYELLPSIWAQKIVGNGAVASLHYNALHRTGQGIEYDSLHEDTEAHQLHVAPVGPLLSDSGVGRGVEEDETHYPHAHHATGL